MRRELKGGERIWKVHEVQNDILVSALLQQYLNIYCAPLSNKEKASLNSINVNQYVQKESAKNRQDTYRRFVL